MNYKLPAPEDYTGIEQYSFKLAKAYATLYGDAITVLNSLQEFVDYYKDFKYVLNDELREMIERAEQAIEKATQ